MLPELQQYLNTNFSGNIKFNPEIKVKREKENDTLYISELKKIRDTFFSIVEVFSSNGATDKAPLSTENLEPRAQKAIFVRLQGMGKNVVVLVLLIVCMFCMPSCAVTHQDIYKQAGYWTYEHHQYKFHPVGEWHFVDQQTATDSTQPFYRLKAVNSVGAEHINYVNN